MSLKGDPNMHVKKLLVKNDREEFLDPILDAVNSGLTSAGSLKKWIIGFIGGADFSNVELADSTTWGETLPEDLPDDEFFIELQKAVKADSKRVAARKSYEF